MRTKYDTYYDLLDKELEPIVTDNYFRGDGAKSKALGFWYLKNEFLLNANDINEILIDGSHDRGIDAYYLDQNTHQLNIFQFKLPQAGNLKGEVDESAITKVYSTVNNLLNNPHSFDNISQTLNEGLLNLIDLIKESIIYNVNIIFVSFNQGIKSESSLSLINQQEKSINPDIVFSHELIDRDRLVNLYDKINRNNSLNLTFLYKNLQPSNSVSSSDGDTYIESWVGVINAKKLIESIGDNLSSIFDENIRLYENKSKINEGIKKTARDSRSATMFYFYNNGITLICDKAKNSPGNGAITLSGVSIVNGAQTVNSLASLAKNDSLDENVDILIRIIQIKEYEQRAKITEYLNSQTPIKESYFIANNSIIRKLQEDLFEKEYYLERQINEYEYKCQYQDMTKFEDYHILPVENAVQHYVGAYVNNKAAQAKSGKSVLFDQNNIEENIKDISAEKVVMSDVLYAKISSIITLYRKNRRNPNNSEFSDYLGIDKSNYISDLYSFLNTGDILLLNSVTNIKRNKPSLTIDESIKESIDLIRDIISSDAQFKDQAPATLTKSNRLFESVQNSINK
ncbi:AIPR family protein [Leuconostoc pseudomesenteroides]|uniref:AIPR family protein n=1 Tax=Leuconostoc pseudomesenteroides TaxID=33968 RepID=UPI0032DF07C4